MHKKFLFFLRWLCKKKRCTSEHDNHLERIANALSQPLPNITLPPPPEEDYIDAFLKLFGYNLRKLLPEKQDEWI